MKPRAIQVTRFPDVVTDLGICDVARVSFLKPASDFSDEQNRSLLRYLSSHAHWSPFGHAYAGYRIQLKQVDQLEFLLQANLAGFSYASDGSFFYLIGSVWAWAQNYLYLPAWAGGRIVEDLRRQFPQSVDYCISPVVQDLPPLFNSRALLRFEECDISKYPQLRYISLRCIAPCFVARQLGKHQVKMVWNEESRRYVDEPPQMYDMVTWRGRPVGSIKQGSGDDHPDSVFAQAAAEALYTEAIRLYTQFIERGIAPEQARALLPQAQQFEWIWTANVRAWKRLCDQRLDPHAQKEAQAFAKQVNELLAAEVPGW